jgi:enoyl-CoA hydratase/carnithine racemase
MARYTGLDVDVRRNGVALLTIIGADGVNSLDARHHRELVDVWRDLAGDDRVSVVVVTGEGAVFCAGGNMEMERGLVGNYAAAVSIMTEARDLVNNIIDCDKPIVSAINGAAAGAGLAVALLADISIVGDDVVLTDGHTRIGLVAGDHAALIWPLLCGMARAKYYLLTCDRIDGVTAERIGLVSKAVPRSDVLSEALAVADRLAAGPQYALRWTKRALNHWLRDAAPAFEASVGMELVSLLGPDFAEGIEAFMDKRAPVFGAPPGVGGNP